MATDGEQLQLCSRCGYDLRLLPVNRCPECGTTFYTSDELRALRHEEVAILDHAERAAAKAVAWLALVIMIGFVLSLIVHANVTDPAVPTNPRVLPMTITVTLGYFVVAAFWLGWRLVRALRADAYRGAVGALVVYLVWSLVGAMIQILGILVIDALPSADF